MGLSVQISVCEQQYVIKSYFKILQYIAKNKSEPIDPHTRVLIFRLTQTSYISYKKTITGGSALPCM